MYNDTSLSDTRNWHRYTSILVEHTQTKLHRLLIAGGNNEPDGRFTGINKLDRSC